MMAASTLTPQEEMELKHPLPQKLFIGSTDSNWSMKTFWDQRSAGGVQSVICYTPPALDAIRWRLGRWWAPNGTVEDDYTTQLPNGQTGYALTPQPLWVIGATHLQSAFFFGKPGTDTTFNSFPNNINGPGKEYKWNEIPECDNPCGAVGSERKEILVVGRGSDRWGIVGGDTWIYSVDSTQLVGEALKHGGDPLSSAFGENGVRGKVFFDHAFDLELPFSKEDIEERTFGSVRQLYVDIKPVYNFYIQSYETKISENSIPEKMLPNMYAFLLVQQEKDPEDVILINEPLTVDDIFEKHLTLGGEMADTMYTVDDKGLPLTREVLNQKGEMTFQKSSKNQYFDKWARSYDIFNQSSESSEIAKRFSNIIVPMSDLSLYRDFDTKRTQFPMYVDINFSTDITKTFFSDALKKSQLSSVFMKDMARSGSVFKPKEYQGPHSHVAIPQSYDYGNNQGIVGAGPGAGPAVFVWWGPRYTGTRRGDLDRTGSTTDAFWGTNGGMWTAVTNIEHDDSANEGTGFRIGDWIKVKNGVHLGEAFDRDRSTDPRVRRGYKPNRRAQIIAYSTNSDSIYSDWYTMPRIPDGPRNIYTREVYSYYTSGAEFYPNTSEFREQLRLRAASEGTTATSPQNPTSRATAPTRSGAPWQAYALYGQNDVILSSRMDPDRNFLLTNTTTKQTMDYKLKEWDITSWFDDFINSPASSFTTGSNNMVFMGQYNEDVAEAKEDSSTNFYKTLMGIIFAGKFNKLVKEKTRSYQQILAGKPAHSEAVFYKVEKWKIDANGDFEGDAPLQSIIFPNSSDIDSHHYIDTQVKYNKNYGYIIYAFVAVFGTRYRYSLDGITGVVPAPANPSQNLNQNSSLPKAEICVFSSPSVRLIQTPYTQFRGRIMDAPPIWPDVNVIQYKNQNNKVLFFFRGNVGNYKLTPIAIEPIDYIDILELAEAQRLRGNEPMEFKSDDQARTFEIFRIDTPPLSYSDFEDHKLATVETDFFEDPKKQATSAAFVDDIVPNKKYYYIFRTVDVHGHTSNPTPIYEISIIDSDGAPVLITNIYQLKKEKDPPQTPVKTAKKYIYITPNDEQLEINKVESQLIIPETGLNKESVPNHVKVDGAVLGNQDETVWDKKYKIRVTSKKTGRKIDFNIQCKVKPWVNTTDG